MYGVLSCNPFTCLKKVDFPDSPEPKSKSFTSFFPESSGCVVVFPFDPPPLFDDVPPLFELPPPPKQFPTNR